MGCRWGVGAGRWEAAGAGRGFFVGRMSTAAPEIQEAPSPVVSRAWETWKPRWGPVVATPGKPTARKAQTPAGEDDPRSQCRSVERPQETGADGRSSAGRLVQLVGYGRLPGPERVLTRVR